jgi:ATP-dependent Lon protease
MFFKNSDSGDKGRPVRVLPLLPLRDIIVFPHMVVPLFVGREKSIASLEEAMANGKDLLLAAQKMAKTNDPKPDDIFTVGTVGSIIQLLRLPDGTVKVLIEGKRRARIRKFLEVRPLPGRGRGDRREGREDRRARGPAAAGAHRPSRPT